MHNKSQKSEMREMVLNRFLDKTFKKIFVIGAILMLICLSFAMSNNKVYAEGDIQDVPNAPEADTSYTTLTP